MGKPTETIFAGKHHVIAMPDVAFIERQYDNKGNPYGAQIVTKNTRWDAETGTWANSCYLPQDEYEAFVMAYGTYRHEVDEPMDIRP